MAGQELAGTRGRLPKAIDRHEQPARVARLLGKLVGSGIGLDRLDRTIPFDCEQRQASGQLQFELSSVLSSAFGRFRECRETALKMADRLDMGGALSGILAGVQPLIDGASGIAGGGQMMRQEFGLPLDEI